MHGDAVSVERVIAANQPITGPNIKAAFEAFDHQSTGSITNPISYSATDHRPTSGALIYSINQFGGLSYQGEGKVELKPEWVGW